MSNSLKFLVVCKESVFKNPWNSRNQIFNLTWISSMASNIILSIKPTR